VQPLWERVRSAVGVATSSSSEDALRSYAWMMRRALAPEGMVGLRCASMCVCVCVCACVRACVRACVCVHVGCRAWQCNTFYYVLLIHCKRPSKRGKREL
jgi:hypothetical protein